MESGRSERERVENWSKREKKKANYDGRRSIVDRCDEGHAQLSY
jgi:hypothetical protein